MKLLTRVGAIVGKEIIEVLRRPGALFSLILGPFLIMAIFGLGYVGRQPLSAVVVVPSGSGLPEDTATYQALSRDEVRIRGVTSDLEQARGFLERRQVDLVLVAPTDLVQTLLQGHQAVIKVEYNDVDPVKASFITLAADQVASDVNRLIIERIVAGGQGQTAVIGAPLPANVVAAPTRSEVQNLAPSPPGLVSFFGPAVLALILQHMAVTLSAMSLVRERMSGFVDLFRMSPASPLEILIGKYVAIGFLCAVISAIVLALVVGLLHVPLVGDPLLIVAAIAVLIFASLGLGHLISMVSDSERQAVQLSLLLLLGSVFFSGFVIDLAQFAPQLQAAALVLPTTAGIALLQDLLLRGAVDRLWMMPLLGTVGIIFLIATWTLLLRSWATQK